MKTVYKFESKTNKKEVIYTNADLDEFINDYPIREKFNISLISPEEEIRLYKEGYVNDIDYIKFKATEITEGLSRTSPLVKKPNNKNKNRPKLDPNKTVDRMRKDRIKCKNDK